MQAIEIDVEIDVNNEIHIKLPEPRQPGPARVIVLFQTQQEHMEQPRHPAASPRQADQGGDLAHGEDMTRRLPSEGTEIEDFAGIWADLPDEDFREFLDDLADRRRRAFSTRPVR